MDPRVHLCPPRPREMLVDSVGAAVKLADALGTPQVKALLEHVAVLPCWIEDVTSTPAARQLYHNLIEAIWATLELAANPEHVLHRPSERRQLSGQNKKS